MEGWVVGGGGGLLVEGWIVGEGGGLLVSLIYIFSCLSFKSNTFSQLPIRIFTYCSLMGGFGSVKLQNVCQFYK